VRRINGPVVSSEGVGAMEEFIVGQPMQSSWPDELRTKYNLQF